MTDKLYYCRKCKKSLWRTSRKRRIRSFCETSGKDVWLVPRKTVRLRLTLPVHVIEFLEKEAARLGIGPNECFDKMMRFGMELEKKK